MLYLKRKPHIMLQLHIPEQIKFNSKPLILFVVLSVTSTIIIVSQRQMLSVNNGDRNEILWNYNSCTCITNCVMHTRTRLQLIALIDKYVLNQIW